MSAFIKQIPAKILAAGPRSAARYVLGTTSLGMFYRSPAIRRAAAEEIVLSALEGIAHLPDCLSQEDALVAAWAQARPLQFAHAVKDAEEAAARLGEVTEADRALRRLVRVAAYRKLDAYQNGNEVFCQTATLAGEPYVEVEIRTAAFKFGQIQHASYTNDIARRDLTREFQDSDLIRQIEQAHFPLLPPRPDPELWAKVCRAWRATMPFREFERRSKLPAFPSAVYFPAKEVPQGYVQRWTEETLASTGISVADAARVGLPMFISDPGVEYLNLRAELVTRLIESPELPVEHMSQWLAA